MNEALVDINGGLQRGPLKWWPFWCSTFGVPACGGHLGVLLMGVLKMDGPDSGWGFTACTRDFHLFFPKGHLWLWLFESCLGDVPRTWTSITFWDHVGGKYKVRSTSSALSHPFFGLGGFPY